MTPTTNVREIIPVWKVEYETSAYQSVSSLVVHSVAELMDKQPDELEPLWDSVDPDALDSVIERAEETRTPCRLTFQYQGCTVEIVADGEVRIAPSEESLPVTV